MREGGGGGEGGAVTEGERRNSEHMAFNHMTHWRREGSRGSNVVVEMQQSVVELELLLNPFI